MPPFFAWMREKKFQILTGRTEPSDASIPKNSIVRLERGRFDIVIRERLKNAEDGIVGDVKQEIALTLLPDRAVAGPDFNQRIAADQRQRERQLFEPLTGCAGAEGHAGKHMAMIGRLSQIRPFITNRQRRRTVALAGFFRRRTA